MCSLWISWHGKALRRHMLCRKYAAKERGQGFRGSPHAPSPPFRTFSVILVTLFLAAHNHVIIKYFRVIPICRDEMIFPSRKTSFALFTYMSDRYMYLGTRLMSLEMINKMIPTAYS